MKEIATYQPPYDEEESTTESLDEEEITEPWMCMRRVIETVRLVLIMVFLVLLMLFVLAALVFAGCIYFTSVETVCELAPPMNFTVHTLKSECYAEKKSVEACLKLSDSLQHGEWLNEFAADGMWGVAVYVDHGVSFIVYFLSDVPEITGSMCLDDTATAFSDAASKYWGSAAATVLFGHVSMGFYGAASPMSIPEKVVRVALEAKKILL